MKKLVFLLFITCYSIFSFSQENRIVLKSGTFKTDNYFDLNISDNDNYRMLFFNQIPNQKQKNELQKLGVEFLYYLPKNIFVVNLQKSISENQLKQYNITSANRILPSYKIDKKLQNSSFPEWCLKDDLLHIKVLFYSNVNFSRCVEKISLLSNKIESINESSKSSIVSIDPYKINSISDLSFVSYIEPIDAPAFPENKTGRTLHRSNTINTDYPTGKNYNGDGVNVMMHDDGYVGPHIDREGRLDQSFCSGCSSSGSDHGDHVSGTIMGAGNLDPDGRGMADGAFLYVLGYSTNNYFNYVPNLYTNYDVVITSASYSNGCNAGYTSLARDLDEQNNTYPNLIHVFSAGNDGNSDCGYGAGSGWGNVTGGHKQAKNVVTVANLSLTGSLSSSSSRGPAADGRIKPDISGKGTSVYSTEENQTYGTKTGTSMSCPGISGVMAQLYHAYKELNSGVNPPSALMKCILLNSADDIGNPGPDFKHGWGEVNAYRAVKMLESVNYISDSISQGNIRNHTINIPSNISKIKIMVYWHDKEASTSASISLVNDINIQLTDSSGVSYNPWVLDPTANSTNLNQNAVRGIDNLNNMEQITIDSPNAGNYTLTIDGYAIPYGPQNYYVTYEFITDDIELTYPIGGEGLVPGDTEYIRWDTYQGGSLSIQYSVDSGVNWSTITNSATASNGYYTWSVPNYVTDEAFIRIIGNDTSQSLFPFTIINVPSNLNVYWPCPDSINFSWSSVSGATSYDICMLGQKYMDSIYSTNSTSVWIINPNPSIIDSWFSVRAKVNNSNGKRAIAINAQSQNTACSGYGCTDSAAVNYDSLAIINDGSCCYISGCTDPSALNYDSLSCFDDGSCILPIVGCTNPSSPNYNPLANTTTAFGGALDNTIGAGGYYYGNRHLIFDAITSCKIVSAVVFADISTNITFELRDSIGNPIDDTTIAVQSGMQRLYFDFDVPIANNLQLGISSSNSGLYRNNTGATFPTTIGSVLTFTGSNITSTQDNWYFYYDIEVEASCDSIILPVYGCTDSTALNYSSLSNTDDGSCCYISGCTDPLAINYDSTACYDDNSCIQAILGCDNPLYINYDPNANTSIAFGGILDSTFGTGGYFNGDQHLIFDASKVCVIKSADIYSESTNTITFELRNSGGNVIDDTTLSVLAGAQRIDLNFRVPIASDMQLGVSSGALSNDGLYRNNSGSNFPYNIGSALNITGTSASTSGYYYFYYNIEVEAECLSESWDCDQDICYDPGTGNGQYSSLAACQANCVSTSIISQDIEYLNLYPNPASEYINIKSINNIDEIRIFDIQSRVVFSEKINSKTKRINISNLSTGIYITEVLIDNIITRKKFVISNEKTK